MRVLRLSKEKMYVSVTYDISSTKARNKIVALLESYGFRVQKSVFEIELNESQYNRLKKQIEGILKYAKRLYAGNSENEEKINMDSVKFYILSKIGEGSLEGRIDGLGDGYEKIYFPDVLIL